MVSYEVTKTCFLNGKRNRVGDIIKYEGKPPSYLKAVEVEAKKKAKK
jgi:hypothetical protein